MWFITDNSRYAQERHALGLLEADSPWLQNVQWRIERESLLLCVDAELIVKGVVRPVTMIYPEVFPSAPPSVRPLNSDVRWSGHQYGAGGELCLEWRPDNWLSTVTGADVLASAYRLLDAEAPAGESSDRGYVLSAHNVSLGQEIRGQVSRLVLTPELLEQVERAVVPLEAQFQFRLRDKTIIAWVSEITTATEVVWKAQQTPAGSLLKGAAEPGFILALAEGDPRIVRSRKGVINGARELRAFLLGDKAPEFTQSEAIVLKQGEDIRAVYLSHEKDAVWEIAVIPPDPGARLPERYAVLTEKTVAVVGCGSMGSKVAASLARAGVRKFVLIDDDIFRPENIVRNDLDWADVALHKTDAVGERIRRIRLDASVDIRRQRLGGQESSGLFAGTMAALAKCDLIIDASGDPTAFNHASDVAYRFQRPMTWAVVFGGGFGGLLARSRPGIDPSPQFARAIFDRWCNEQNVSPPPEATRSYEAIGDEGPMVADDSDVSVMAGHLARFSIDLLSAPDDSRFEFSAYVIGFRKDWVFSAAFDTHPINLGSPEERPPEAQMSVEEKLEALTSLLGLLKPSNDPHPA
ncbi:ThiF family adenylyltransferase [Cupriavidus pinatubonensis]|uniref:THIF-type NAD/FAD binding fold domain-containing protein n=1 Tax=Cupriavidus pinatubonensis TaxID=248026 RepID=A0ABN7Z8I0_9BURK|nr:ThiF family adenylyltransferase [Cupriavidus pinatubonensis]CAG9180610.1 hypothetical protein LMG23994_04458 [Cupriavidus pinatubonensis]